LAEIAGADEMGMIGQRSTLTHPLAWAAVCVGIALLATVFAVGVFRDPQASRRRAFLRGCHEQAYDRGETDHCPAESQVRFGAFNTSPQNVAFVVAAGAIFTGTALVLVYVMRQVGGSVG
jgi:hypothetical protein